jgi:hypothetical protein
MMSPKKAGRRQPQDDITNVPNKSKQEKRPAVGRARGRPPADGGPRNNPQQDSAGSVSGSDNAGGVSPTRGTSPSKGTDPSDGTTNRSNTLSRNTSDRRRERYSPKKGNTGGGKDEAAVEATAGEKGFT